MISHKKLTELVSYDQNTGLFTRLKRTAPRTNPGELAGNKNNKGYIRLMLNCKNYQAHRLVWFYVTGFWPKKQIDHINGVKTDNRIANLRLANGYESQQNRKLNKNNTSGHHGVSYDKNVKKWRARIKANGVRVSCGFYVSPEDASMAYLSAKGKLHTFNPTTRVV